MAKAKNRKKQMIALGIVAATVTAVLAVYIGVSVYYKGHFFPGTQIGGIACGNKTPEYVIGKNRKDAQSYVLTIRDRKDGRFYIAGTDISYDYIMVGREEELLKQQNGFAWPVEVFKKRSYDMTASFTYDEVALRSQIQKLEIFNKEYIDKPVSAKLVLNEDGYELIPEVMGNKPIEETIQTEIKGAVDHHAEDIELSDDCYVKPKVLQTDAKIADAVNAIEHYMASTIHYEIEGCDENLTSEMIYKLLDVTKKGKVSINEDRLARFVQHLASTYNTYADVREFKTSKGDTVKIGGGDYGWVISKGREREQILSDLEGGVPVSREPEYEQRAVQSGLDDIGNTYVEIDYTNQHLWFYKEGELVVETDIVSGNLSRGNGSPDGVFKIVYCQRNAVLVGEDYQSNVDFFMPFAYNVGIHDASWRSKFGGEIYKTSGSHGCINVPRKYAKKIYEEIKKGTPVIAFYRDPIELTSENARVSNAFSYKKPEEDSSN